MIESAQRLGWADAVNLGLHQSAGRPWSCSTRRSSRPATSALLAAFDDERVGLAGPWGVTSRDGRQFEDAPPGEVDAIEGCLAIRRQALQQVGGFDHRFRFYRNADLDLSFAVRANGWTAIRTEPLRWSATSIGAGWPTRMPSAIGSASAPSLPLPEALGRSAGPAAGSGARPQRATLKA